MDYFSLCTGFYEMTPGILGSILAVGILSSATEQSLTDVCKKEVHF